MQTLVAYALDREPDERVVGMGLARVAAHFESIWRGSVELRSAGSGRCGLALWDAETPHVRWPSWEEDAELHAASLYVPLLDGLPAGTDSCATGPLRIARELARTPSAVLSLTPPFVVAALSRRGGLRLHTDALGVGRLFGLRFASGWVWSNRPVAACLFAGRRTESDRDAWRTFASTGWFLGDRTPFANIFAIPAGSTITCGRGPSAPLHSRIDALGSWAAGSSCNALDRDRIDSVAEALKRTVSAIGARWPDRPLVDLSGGRDSRLVVAAALAAGLDVMVRTNGAEPGEANVAETLMAALPPRLRTAEHRVTRPRPAPVMEELALIPNAIQWHRCQDGLRPATYLATRAPAGLGVPRDLVLSGAAGEIAHGHYYDRDYSAIGSFHVADKLDVVASKLSRKIVLLSGPSRAAKETTVASVRRTLDDALIRGIGDARMLDYFYAAERLRRWGSAGESLGRVTPLLTPGFVRAALDATPHERRASKLHAALTARLVPEWKDQPYYARPRRPLLAAATLGSPSDRAEISAVVAEDAMYADAFDPPEVRRSWKRLKKRRGTAQDRTLVERVCWLATFERYLSEVNEGGPVS